MKFLYISTFFLFLLFGAHQASAETVPVGFSNSSQSKEIMEAWRNKAVVFNLDNFGKELTGDGGTCFEFNDHKDCEVVSFTKDGKAKRKKDSDAQCEVTHYTVDKDGFGYKEGEYVLSIIAIGTTVAMPFEKPIDPGAEELKARNGFTLSIKPKGYCSQAYN